MPRRPENNGGFVNKIRALAAPPTPGGRLRNATTNFFISAGAIGVYDLINQQVIKTTHDVGTLLGQVNTLLPLNTLITAEQLTQVINLESKIAVLLYQGDLLNNAKSIVYFLSVIAFSLFVYNGGHWAFDRKSRNE